MGGGWGGGGVCRQNIYYHVAAFMGGWGFSGNIFATMLLHFVIAFKFIYDMTEKV